MDFSIGTPPQASAGKNFSIRQPNSIACSTSLGVQTAGKKFRLQETASATTFGLNPGATANFAPASNARCRSFPFSTVPAPMNISGKRFDASRITDSAASGTALASGFKTNNSSVGVFPDGSPCTSIAALAKARGMSVGILTDDYLTGATPAAFYAHQPNRAMTDEIMAELVHSGYEIFFANDTGSDSLRDNQTTGTNLVEVMTGLGYAFSYTVNDFKTSLTQSEKSVGLIPSGEISFQKGDVRVLGDVMQASLERLNRNPNGFFMLFECSLPDKGGHSSDMNQSVFGTLRTDWLVKTAVDFALTHPGTLVVVTADHETGGISAVRGTADADPVAYTREPNHTSAPVPVGAFGPGAQLFARVLDNTDIPRIMAYLLKLEMPPRS